MYFIETADTMARMSRETLVNARCVYDSFMCNIITLTSNDECHDTTAIKPYTLTRG